MLLKFKKSDLRFEYISYILIFNIYCFNLTNVNLNDDILSLYLLQVAQNNYQILLEEKDVNNLTGALKLFFRELKEPLIPYNAYEAFIKGMAGK